jgi:2-alkenal reductase
LINQSGQSQQGGGSGFILNDDGYIVTNNHVVNLADRVSVVFYNGFEELAEVVGTDPDSDLAVLKVNKLPEGAASLPLGDSDDVVEGQWAVAIGNPFGLDGSMSIGIVSAVGRSIPSGATPFQIPQAIQTDAAINPGNSGGPLLNLDGDIIGVNAQIASGGTRANSGVGFAIPSNVVRQVVPVLIEQGEYQWPWLGIRGGPVSLLYQQANDLDSQDGAFITSVIEDGPAEAAGLQGSNRSETIDGIEVPVGGDVIIGFNGETVNNFADLLYFVSSQSPGDKVSLTILRDGQEQQVEVTLQTRPE